MGVPGSATATLVGKRVVLVLAWSVLGGAERSALKTAVRLDEVGADVSVLALTSEDGRARGLFSSRGIPWHTLPTDWHGGRLEKARQLGSLTVRLRAMRPDVLLPYTSRPNVLCGLIWRATGASLSIWNQQDVGRATKFGPRLTSFAVQRTPLFVANSEAARTFLVEELRAPAERVHVVLAGVARIDIGDGRPDAARALFGIDVGAPVVSMLAHLHPVKDHSTLLRAWRIVLDERGADGPVLLLAGRPSGSEDALKALAFDLDLGRSVRFLGDVEDVETVLAASDIAALSSRSESRPHALLESAAAGLPIAATDVPGISSALGEHQAPYLVPPGDAERLAAVLIQLLSDPVLRQALGRENRRILLASSADQGSTTADLIVDALTR